MTSLDQTQASGAQYVVTKSAALSGAASVVTVQQPATGSKRVKFCYATISSTVACPFTVERDGTGATATAVSPIIELNTEAPTAAATAFTSSDVGTGRVVADDQVPANGRVTIDLRDHFMFGDGTGKNLSIRTASVTGTVKICIYWKEPINSI